MRRGVQDPKQEYGLHITTRSLAGVGASAAGSISRKRPILNGLGWSLPIGPQPNGGRKSMNRSGIFYRWNRGTFWALVLGGAVAFPFSISTANAQSLDAGTKVTA